MPASDANPRKTSPLRIAALAFVGVLVTVLVLWLTASRVGLWPASWSFAGRHGAARTDGERLPAGTMNAALDLASGWVDAPAATSPGGHARDATSSAPRATLAVIWCDTDPDGLASLARAEELREAYASDGVRVIAIHAPDFSFAADTAVVARAARRAGAGVEIALDADGRMREKLGMTGAREGAVLADSSGATVLAMRSLDGVRRADLALRDMLSRPDRASPNGVAAAEITPLSIGPPIYLGVGRVSNGPLATATVGRATPFAAPFRFEVEGEALVPYPVGWWTPSADGLTASHGGAASFVALRFESGGLAAVISPPNSGSDRVWILCDEHWLPAAKLGADARLDSRGASYVEVTEPRLYEIVNGFGRHVVKLSPDAAGVTLHAFVIEAHGSAPASR